MLRVCRACTEGRVCAYRSRGIGVRVDVQGGGWDPPTPPRPRRVVMVPKQQCVRWTDSDMGPYSSNRFRRHQQKREGGRPGRTRWHGPSKHAFWEKVPWPIFYPGLSASCGETESAGGLRRAANGSPLVVVDRQS
jgi:hypothetical protein